MDKWFFFIALCGVLIGWLSNTVMSSISFENPYTFTAAAERFSPSNHINENQIQVYDEFAVVRVPNLLWAKFTDTNSMDPVLDKEANAFETKPKNPDDIHVGDIISYSFGDILVIHRVIRTGNDENGWYAIVKGDNNPSTDPEPVRFSQVHGVVVGILY